MPQHCSNIIELLFCIHFAIFNKTSVKLFWGTQYYLFLMKLGVSSITSFYIVNVSYTVNLQSKYLMLYVNFSLGNSTKWLSGVVLWGRCPSHCCIFFCSPWILPLNFDALIQVEDISDTTYHRLGTLVFLFLSVYFYGSCAQACGGNNTAIQHHHCNVLLSE